MIDGRNLINIVQIRVIKPLQIPSLYAYRVLLVLVDRSILHFVHLVELSLKQDEVLSSLRLRVHQSRLELLEGVDDLKEITLSQEELEILCFAFLY